MNKLVENSGIVLFIGGFVLLGVGILGYVHAHSSILLLLGIFICCLWTGGTFYETYIKR